MNSIDIRPSYFDRLLMEKKNLIGVEIGVYKGEHAQSMLEMLDIKKLYLIDPYELYPGYKGLGIRGWRSLPETLIYAQKMMREKGFENKVKWLIMMANDAVDQVKEKLDFIYIDGNHDYRYVMDDIVNWVSKVKKGGLVGGHDYTPTKFGVYEAVNTYCGENKIKFDVFGGEWFFWKK